MARGGNHGGRPANKPRTGSPGPKPYKSKPRGTRHTGSPGSAKMILVAAGIYSSAVAVFLAAVGYAMVIQWLA